mmetsp:Transcript_48476/g.126696  ORF Transcript_48476/g.126696 Transcript_48476/m.126696 type:complete len:258 (-) Transcript_48476:2169-2942(-)
MRRSCSRPIAVLVIAGQSGIVIPSPRSRRLTSLSPYCTTQPLRRSTCSHRSTKSLRPLILRFRLPCRRFRSSSTPMGSPIRFACTAVASSAAHTLGTSSSGSAQSVRQRLSLSGELIQERSTPSWLQAVRSCLPPATGCCAFGTCNRLLSWPLFLVIELLCVACAGASMHRTLCFRARMTAQCEFGMSLRCRVAIRSANKFYVAMAIGCARWCAPRVATVSVPPPRTSASGLQRPRMPCCTYCLSGVTGYTASQFAA